MGGISSKNIFFVFLTLFLFFGFSGTTFAAKLKITPSTASFAVDSTFDISVMLDTEGESINAIDVELKFPPEKLQLVSPKTSQSIISVWTSQPKFNNQTGVITLQGGIPGGVNLSGAMVATLTFRVKSVGSAIVKFQDASRVLLNDGLGTDVLTNKVNASFELKLPPPAGPIVVSETHPEQSKWYSKNNLVLRWANEENVSGYSYVLNKEPVSVIDDISEGIQRFISYKDLSDGQYYFHIKALRDGIWGGETHFASYIDATPPADFKVDILPSSKTSSTKPIIKFGTSDQLSGLDHYEIKIIPLSEDTSLVEGNQPFFIEAQSPFILENLDLGSYDVIVRAYDRAGNFRDVTEKMVLYGKVFSFASVEGIKLGNSFLVSWQVFIGIIAFVIAALTILFVYIKRRHDTLHHRKGKYDVSEKLKDQLEELKKYRSKYGNISLFFLLVFSSFVFSSSIVFAEDVTFTPPIITAISNNISNEEIFYVGGEVDIGESTVTIYIQNEKTNETQSRVVTADNKGEWFYRHDGFLNGGEYLIWSQASFAEFVSPPSAQERVIVEETALQIGGSRLSFRTIYLILFIFFVVVTVGLLAYILHFHRETKKKEQDFIKEVREAEEAIRNGFRLLHSDVEKEKEIFKKLKEGRGLTDEEIATESRILKDLEHIESKIINEVRDVST